LKEVCVLDPLSTSRRVALGSLAWVGILLSGLSEVALAQDSHELANVLGRVVQAGSRAPLPEAEVGLPDLDMGTETDEEGRFWFRNVPAGEHVFVFQYLGFADSATVYLAPNELNQLEVAIDLLVVPVADLVVRVEALEGPGKLTAFNRRRAKGEGYFITREDILQRAPVRTTDMLRTVPGIRISPTLFGRAAIRMRGRSCSIAYFVDGVRAPYFDMNTVQPSSVAGIEIYKGTASVPPEFRGPLTPCAAIVLWTRDPSLP
jgi:hypothetical protein